MWSGKAAAGRGSVASFPEPFVVGPHYRSSIEYSDTALQESVAAYRRIESFVHRVRERLGTPAPGVLCAAFTGQVTAQGALQALGAGEGEVSIIAWAGYIERGETDKAYDWVTTNHTTVLRIVDVEPAAGAQAAPEFAGQAEWDWRARLLVLSLHRWLDRRQLRALPGLGPGGGGRRAPALARVGGPGGRLRHQGGDGVQAAG